MGEQSFANGRFDEAIQLWRHALLQLPETPAADELRHKLILRIGYGQIVAHAASGDRTHLVNAQQMLLRYAAKHEQLLGDRAGAERERGDVFELLYQVERRLEPETDDTPDEAEPVARGRTTEVRVDTKAPAVAWPRDRDDEQPLARPVEPDARPRRVVQAPVDTHEGESLTGEIKRDVSVRTGRWLNTDVNDPEIRRRLSGLEFESTASAVLTAPRAQKIHGPRPLLRQIGPAGLVGPQGDKRLRQLARTAGRALFTTARPELRTCYGAAVARRPIMLADSTVEVSIHPDGTVTKARIVEGGLVDGLGDVCMIERMEAARLSRDVPGLSLRVRIAMRFFYEDAKYIHGGTGDTGPIETLDQRWEGDPTSGGLPPIDSGFLHPSDEPHGGPTP
jgi:hypothetical protein